MPIIVTDASTDRGQVRVTNTDSGESETVPQRAEDIDASVNRMKEPTK